MGWMVSACLQSGGSIRAGYAVVLQTDPQHPARGLGAMVPRHFLAQPVLVQISKESGFCCCQTAFREDFSSQLEVKQLQSKPQTKSTLLADTTS